MKTSKKVKTLQGLSKHIQGLIAVCTMHGINVKGVDGIIYAMDTVYNINTGEEAEERFPLTNSTTLSKVKNWLGY